MYYFLVFISALILAVFFTLIIKRIAVGINVIDFPDKDRKIHKKNIPLLGGFGIFLSLFVVFFIVRDKLLTGDLGVNHWIGVFIGACILMLGGFLDDKYDLKPKYQIIFPLMAALCVIVSGVNIEKITNPLGGFLYFTPLVSGLLIYVWLMGMMYTTKILDGIDGLVTGITAIGGFIIFLFTTSTKYNQPDIGLAALILAGASIGFLIFNWHPAKIFLGEGGSLFLGFILGVLAIISGGKIAIALLIMGLPIMDLAWTIIRRVRFRKNPFKFADRKHLHFRILDFGIGQRKTVLIYYLFSVTFGLSALFLQGTGKMFALLLLVVIMFAIVAGLGYIDRRAAAAKK